MLKGFPQMSLHHTLEGQSQQLHPTLVGRGGCEAGGSRDGLRPLGGATNRTKSQWRVHWSRIDLDRLPHGKTVRW